MADSIDDVQADVAAGKLEPFGVDWYHRTYGETSAPPVAAQARPAPHVASRPTAIRRKRANEVVTTRAAVRRAAAVFTDRIAAADLRTTREHLRRAVAEVVLSAVPSMFATYRRDSELALMANNLTEPAREPGSLSTADYLRTLDALSA